MVAGIATAQTENEKSNLLAKAKAFVNKNVVHGVDTNYVKAPKQPWQVSVKSRAAQTDLQMHSTIDGGELFDGEGVMPFLQGVGDMAMDSRIRTKVSTSIGVKVGYKGLSISYSFPVGGDKSQNLTLRSVGKWYSLNLRWHKFKSNTMENHFSGAAKSRSIEHYDEETGDGMPKPSIGWTASAACASTSWPSAVAMPITSCLPKDGLSARWQCRW